MQIHQLTIGFPSCPALQSQTIGSSVISLSSTLEDLPWSTQCQGILFRGWRKTFNGATNALALKSTETCETNLPSNKSALSLDNTCICIPQMNHMAKQLVQLKIRSQKSPMHYAAPLYFGSTPRVCKSVYTHTYTLYAHTCTHTGTHLYCVCPHKLAAGWGVAYCASSLGC